MKNALLEYVKCHFEKTEIIDDVLIRQCEDITYLSIDGDNEAGGIFLVDDAKDVYEDLRIKTDRMGRDSFRILNRYFKYFLFGFRMDETQFRYEGRHQYNGHELALWAFKANQIRIYGIRLGEARKHFFFGSSSDDKKKQNKANKQKLERAVRVYSKWLETLMNGQ